MLNIFNESEEMGSLTSQVFHKLEREILEGVLKPGESLTELKISHELGVSRTPVREALLQLEQEGLVKITRNKGAYVIGISEKDIHDIYTMRMRIEGLASRWAAERISEKELKKLSEIVELEMFYAAKGDIVNSRNLDTSFHSVLYAASGSNPLRNTLKAFHNYIGRAREISFSSGDRASVAAKEHFEILNAISSRDGDKAEELTILHIQNALKNLISSIKTP